MIDIALKALLRRVFRVTLSLLSFSMLSGCSSEGGVVDAPTTQQQMIPDSAVIWQVENIAERGVVDSSMTTVQFFDDGRIGGSTGCNKYFGQAAIDGRRITFDRIGSTRRACVPALNDQEQRFLAAMKKVVAFTISEDKGLVLYDEFDFPQLEMMQLSPQGPS